MSPVLGSWTEDRASCPRIVHDPHQAINATNRVTSGPLVRDLDPGPLNMDLFSIHRTFLNTPTQVISPWWVCYSKRMVTLVE